VGQSLRAAVKQVPRAADPGRAAGDRGLQALENVHVRSGRHARRPDLTMATVEAPNAEVTVYPWREPPELLARTIDRVRTSLRAHQPLVAAAAQ
jgi:hypothetical protein